MYHYDKFHESVYLEDRVFDSAGEIFVVVEFDGEYVVCENDNHTVYFKDNEITRIA